MNVDFTLNVLILSLGVTLIGVGFLLFAWYEVKKKENKQT